MFATYMWHLSSCGSIPFTAVDNKVLVSKMFDRVIIGYDDF